MKILTPAVLIISCFAISMSSLSGQKSLALSARPYVMFKQNTSTQSPLYQLDHKRIYAHAQQNRVEGFLLQLDFPGQLAWKMYLKPSIVHDKDFHLITNTGERIEVSQQITYQGYLTDRPSVKIAMTITEDYLHGRIFDQQVYSFETYRNESAGPLVQFVQEKVQLQRAHQCGSSRIQYQRNTTDSPLPKLKYREQNKQVGTPAPVELASIPNGNVLVRIGPTLDWQAFNGRINQNAANFNTDLQTMINNINVHYASFGVSYITTAAYIITSGPNPWTDYPNGNGDSNRQSFSNWAWSNNGFPYTCDVPMLFTGQDFGEISWGSINAMCTSYASVQMDYHIDTPIPTAHRSNIMSHELGHVWGANHISFNGTSYYMNGTIYAGNLQWYSNSASVISNSIQAASCLEVYSCGNSTDVDGDGVCADVDCDDNDPQITTTDADGDGICSDQDCDDTDGIPSICVQYCIPEHSQCCLEYIENVSLNDLNNSTGNALISQGATGYSDYTNLSTELERGNSYTINIDANDSFSDSKVGVWIDWNEDGTFSTQERVLNRSGFGPWSASFTVPNGAKLGSTRMRVRLQFGANYTPDPCDYSYYYNGETEDYTINVINGCPTDADGDGVCSDIDCDDSNAQITSVDLDGDGICGDLDCDDNDAQVASIDADGDGLCSDIDCDDNNAQITTTDADGDGLCSDIDCDDTDGIPNACVQYCTPEHNQCCLEYIQNVSLNDLNNSTGNALVSQGATGYSDYTNLSTDLEREASYTINIDANDSFSDSKVGVWIDWNEDGTFSSQEQVLNKSGLGPWSASFTVPSVAKLGSTRMRVRLQFGANYTPDPCDYSYYYNGESEDYTINVLENSCGTPGIIDADGDGLCSDIDCDDSDAQVTTTDADDDGFCSDQDCNDNNASIYPEAPCDDNNSATTNDQYDSNCNCIGTPLGNNQTLSRQISSFDDDVEERESDGLMYDSSNDLELVYDGWNSMGKQTVGLRFTNLTIPQGATINTAFLQFSSRGNHSSNADLIITGHAHNNAPAFSSTNFDASSRTRTSTSVNWLPPAWTKGETGPAQQSPDLSAIVQELVDRPGWNSGQGMVFLINGRKKRRAASYDYDPSRAPELIITYSTAACSDSDNDGVCDDEDICPGGDDNLDADSDGIPDACDSYCVPEHVNCCNEYLVDVSLNTLNNSSGSPLASGGVTGYSDYTNLSTTLNAGSSYSLDVSPNFSFSSSKAGVWIDWNQDKIFSSNEAVLSTSGSGPWNASVQVPANAKVGPTRMRVRLQYGSSYTPDPCDYSYYYNGETEDYSIIVSSSSAKNTDQEDWTPIKLDQPQRPFLSRLHVYPNPTQGRIWINYQAVQRQEVALSLYDRLGRKLLQKIQLAEEGDNTYPLTFDTLAPGIYFISLRTADGQWMQKVVLTR